MPDRARTGLATPDHHSGDVHAPRPSHAEALARMDEAEDTLRAIGDGEIDAFVISGAGHERVFSLTTADRPYRIFVEHMHDGAATVSSDGIVLYSNRRLADMVGRQRDELAGSRLCALVNGDSSHLERLCGQGPIDPTLELDLVTADGGVVPVLVGISPLDVDGEQLTCLTFTDLSSQKASDREIARLGRAQAARLADLQEAQVALTVQATHDALTGLPNRALLVDRADQAIVQSERSGRCTVVLFVDLDGFKQVNDAHGHAAGDAFLQHVAEGLLGILRPMDTVARLGGDEFVILAPNIDSRGHALDLGMRVSTDLAAWLQQGPLPGSVTASVGIAVSEAGRGTAELLLGEADRAMYEAKSRGGARVEVFDAALRSEVEKRTAAELMIRTALDEQRIAVRYQPIVDLATDGIACFEALARIVRPDGTVLPPAAFIPVAEESGLILEIGGQVLRSACAEAGGWQAVGSSPLGVAVNLSPRQLDSGNLMADLVATLERTGLSPDRLHLEITETAIIDLSPELLRQLGEIRELGVQIGLDDFGTGYASLTHLRRLPLTFVKIDRSFVANLLGNRDDERIVSAVIDLAANLGLRSVAEGVETLEQLDRLRALGCDQAQGYLFARPMPPEEVDPAIRSPDVLAIRGV